MACPHCSQDPKILSIKALVLNQHYTKFRELPSQVQEHFYDIVMSIILHEESFEHRESEAAIDGEGI